MYGNHSHLHTYRIKEWYVNLRKKHYWFLINCGILSFIVVCTHLINPNLNISTIFVSSSRLIPPLCLVDNFVIGVVHYWQTVFYEARKQANLCSKRPQTGVICDHRGAFRPLMMSFITHPTLFNSCGPNAVYKCRRIGSLFVEVMSVRLFSIKSFFSINPKL